MLGKRDKTLMGRYTEMGKWMWDGMRTVPHLGV